MTKARLTTWINWDPDGTGVGADLPGPNAVEMDIEVKPGDEPITIVITDTGVQTSVRNEPKFVIVPDEVERTLPPLNPKFWQCEEVGYHLSATNRHTFQECQDNTGLEVER